MPALSLLDRIDSDRLDLGLVVIGEERLKIVRITGQDRGTRYREWAYFEELAEIAASGRRLSDEEWTDLYLRHDQYMV